MLKYPLHPGMNTITHFGTLELKYLEYQEKKLMGWFLAHENTEPDSYQVYIALTGETVHDEYRYICSTQTQLSGGYFVVHAFD
jgi:hypothetical protein